MVNIRKNKGFILCIVLLFPFCNAYAQDDLLDLLEEEKEQKVIATFKTTRIVNSHSIETVKARALDFRVTHHFGNIAGSSGGFHSFYGLDQAADIRIAFEYGINEKFTAGLGRSKVQELVDGYFKYRLLTQTESWKVPVSITALVNSGLVASKANEGPYKNFTNRLSYTFELLIARKFNSRFSAQLMPVLLHRNYIFDSKDANDIFALGSGARLKLSKRFAVLADYYFIFSNYRLNQKQLFSPPLGIGIEIETGGHIFHMFFTNNAGIVENNFLATTTESWKKGEFKFGFNISRTFGIGKKR